MVEIPEVLITFYERFVSFFTSNDKRPIRATFGLMTVLIFITLGMTSYDVYYNVSTQNRNLESKAQRFEYYFLNALKEYGQLANNTAAIFSLTRDIELRDWNYYVTQSIIKKNYPEITFIAMAQKAQPENIEGLIAYEKKLNNRNFQNRTPVLSGGSAFIRYYSDLKQLHSQDFVGYDLFDLNPSLIPQFQNAVIQNSPFMIYMGISHTITKLSKNHIEYVVPVFYNPDNLMLQQLGQNDTLGWVVLSIELEQLINRIRNEIPWLADLEMDIAQVTPNKTIILNGIHKNNSSVTPIFKDIQFLNAHWKISFSKHGQYIHIAGFPFSISTFVMFGLGLLFSVLIAMLFWTVINTRQKAFAIADRISQDLKKQESQHRRLIANAPGVIFSCDPKLNWKMTYLSDQFENLTGYAADDFVNNKNRAYIDLVYYKDIQSIERKIGFVPKPGSMYFHEYRIIHSDGSLHWIHERARVVRNEDTGEYYLTGSFFDVTEQKRKEAENRILTNALENAVDGIAFLDRSFTFQKVNEPFARMFDKTPAQFTRMSISHILNDKEVQKFQEAITLLTKQDKVSLNLEAYNNSKRVFLNVVLVPALKDASEQQLMGVYCFAKDVSRDIEREMQLSEAVRAAEAANQTKSTFLATMSHELRTPLNAIIGYSDMLIEDVAELGLQEQEADLKKINSAGRHLLALINDILDVSKLEAGKMTIYLETFNIYETCKSIMDMMYPSAEKNSNTLVLECQEDMGEMYSDATKLRQSLFNLLSNACKFTKEGTITLKVSSTQKGSMDYIYFSVADTGIGITPEQLQKLFQPFTQADSSTTRNFGGTGLGLTITKRFCEMLNGDCLVDSIAGQGTTFTLILPRHSVAITDSPSEKPSNKIAS